MFYKSFECVFGDTDRDKNDYLNIDGYPENENESGAVIATVYYTPHEDFVVHFNFEEYKDVPEVKELIEEAKKDLISVRNQEKNMTIEEKISAICAEDNYAIFKIDEYTKPTLEIDDAGQTFLNVEIDSSIDVRATIAEECLPSYTIEGILNEADCNTLAEAIETGVANLSISFRYYKDMATDEITLKEAEEKNDPTLCDRVYIACLDLDNMQTDVFQPHNQEWFRNFINEELAGLNLQSAREFLSEETKPTFNLTIGEEVGISLKELYKHFPVTEYGHIRHSQTLGDEYYDFYDKSEDFMLCDGEIVTIKKITNNDVVFSTDEGFDFRLTKEEAGIAVFKESPEKNRPKSIESERI